MPMPSNHSKHVKHGMGYTRGSRQYWIFPPNQPDTEVLFWVVEIDPGYCELCFVVRCLQEFAMHDKESLALKEGKILSEAIL